MKHLYRPAHRHAEPTSNPSGAAHRAQPARQSPRPHQRAAAVTAGVTAIGVVAAGVAVAATSTSSASTVTLAASADTFVSSSAPTQNYGASGDFRVSNAKGAVKVAYLRFSIPSADVGRVASAKLVISRTTHHLPASTITAHVVADTSWAESALVMAGAPASGAALSSAVTNSGVNKVSLNVTSAAEGSVANLSLTSPVTDGVMYFTSRQGGANGPQLVLTLNAPTTPTTTASTTTAPTTTASTTTASTTTASTTTASTTTASTTTAPTTTAPTTTAPTTTGPAPAPGSCTISPLLVSSCQRWFGVAPQVYANQSSTTSLDIDEAFSGANFQMLHWYNTNGKLFPSASDISRAEEPGANRVLYENWKPATDMTWAKVAAGGADARIDAEAAYLKSNFDYPFLLSIWHEPENDVIATAGSGMTVPDYAAMYRHVILRLRADGANKFVSVMNYMGYSRWDYMLDGLWPGNDVVDWIAWDAYMHTPSDQPGHDFSALVSRFYSWATANHPGKPLMLGEYGASWTPAAPSGQATFFDSMVKEIGDFPALRAVNYFDADPKYVTGTGNTPNSSPASLAAWKAVMHSPLFRGPGIVYRDGELHSLS